MRVTDPLNTSQQAVGLSQHNVHYRTNIVDSGDSGRTERGEGWHPLPGPGGFFQPFFDPSLAAFLPSVINNGVSLQLFSGNANVTIFFCYAAVTPHPRAPVVCHTGPQGVGAGQKTY